MASGRSADSDDGGWAHNRSSSLRTDTPVSRQINKQVTSGQVCTHRRNVLAVQVLLVRGEEPTVAARLVGERLLEVGGDAAAVGARGAGLTARGRTGTLCGWKEDNINCDVIVMLSE